ncbi:P-loop containing nucleoside triphosphate hydrolase protein [Aspergillus coremiiformis]|uniref:P-loop containing nucleoside triphosphate hydrolase protein n=1 Tax=Aspergillus coremiiformis TaxID=138285 RepID=A0A5N6ZLJ3_9EURO|nr:P-loop containing nucleoside triphosphate hydrolase protein [Aspergillus coremiiformis]
MSVTPPLIRIQDGTFYEKYPAPDDAANNQNPPLFPNFNFILQSNQANSAENHGDHSPQYWAVIGNSGRTQLLDILRGQYVCLPPTARSYPYLLTDDIANKDPRLRVVGNAIQYIGFSGEGSGAIGGTRGAYLSARYESHREETDWSVLQYLKGQTSLNPLEGEQGGIVQDEELLHQVITDLRLGELLDMPVANLSNGQTRRARIAKALLNKPELLLLDDPFMGLDPATVRSISGLLQRLAAKSDPRLILALRPHDPVPDWITHFLVLGNSNRVLFQGSRAEADKVFEIWKQATLDRKPPVAREEAEIYHQTKSALEAGHLDRQLLWDLRLVTKKKVSQIMLSASKGGEPLIEMEGVRVQYGDKIVLGGWTRTVNKEEKVGLHWTVRRGHRWVILGANGSGKTTLLSLITSDHPQAYALPIKLFGRSRLPEAGKPGISIFELQSRMGHSSPEIHAFFPRQLSIRQAIESAFAETFLSKPTLDHERDLDVSATLRYFKAELDPNAAVTMHEKRFKVGTNLQQQHFPKISYNKGRNPFFYPPDYDVEYADSTRFGELNTAQQRLVLFIRAIIHRPDIVILDEAFSGMPASVRDKCIHFLEAGECSRNRVSSITRRTNNKETWLQGFNADESAIRYRGLSDDQALIMICHNREEIPDTVRHYMRLPSEAVGDSEPLDFRFGILKYKNTFNDPDVWNKAWLPPSEFEHRASKSRRGRVLDESPEAAADEDMKNYGWYSL